MNLDVGRIAATTLPDVGVGSDPIRITPSPDLLQRVELRQVLGPVRQAVATGTAVGASGEWSDLLDARYRASLGTTMSAHAAAVEIIGTLTQRGIDATLLKGCATGHLDHVRPADRFSSDVDILVRPDDLVATIDSLSPADRPVGRSERWQREYGKSMTIEPLGAVHIDVHTALTDGYFGMSIPFDELTAHRASFELAGRQVAALDAPGRLLHAALHLAMSSDYGLNSAYDVPLLVLSDPTTWGETADRATQWRIEAAVAAGIRLAWEDFGLDDHPALEWARTVTPGRRQRWAWSLAQSRPGGYHYTTPLALSVQRWPGYLAPIVLPSKEYLDARGETRRSHLASTVRQMMSSDSN